MAYGSEMVGEEEEEEEDLVVVSIIRVFGDAYFGGFGEKSHLAKKEQFLFKDR